MPSSSARASAARRQHFYEPAALPKYRPDRIDKQERAVAFALTRVRSARSHLARDPSDRVWQAALESRKQEYERERLALERLTT